MPRCIEIRSPEYLYEKSVLQAQEEPLIMLKGSSDKLNKTATIFYGAVMRQNSSHVYFTTATEKVDPKIDFDETIAEAKQNRQEYERQESESFLEKVFQIMDSVKDPKKAKSQDQAQQVLENTKTLTYQAWVDILLAQAIRMSIRVDNMHSN